MGQTLPVKTSGEHAGRSVDRTTERLLADNEFVDRPLDRVIEKLLTENAQLRDLVI